MAMETGEAVVLQQDGAAAGLHHRQQVLQDPPHSRASSAPSFTLSLLVCAGGLEGAPFPCTDDCQVTFVNLKCDSSKKRRRGRKSPTKEVSHITAEFEMEMKEEETSGETLGRDVKKETDSSSCPSVLRLL